MSEVYGAPASDEIMRGVLDVVGAPESAYHVDLVLFRRKLLAAVVAGDADKVSTMALYQAGDIIASAAAVAVAAQEDGHHTFARSRLHSAFNLGGYFSRPARFTALAAAGRWADLVRLWGWARDSVGERDGPRVPAAIVAAILAAAAPGDPSLVDCVIVAALIARVEEYHAPQRGARLRGADVRAAAEEAGVPKAVVSFAFVSYCECGGPARVCSLCASAELPNRLGFVECGHEYCFECIRALPQVARCPRCHIEGLRKSLAPRL